MPIVSKAAYAGRVRALPADAWQKPHRSGPVSDNCLETAYLGDGVWALRDSTAADSPVIVLTDGEMQAFAGSAADGQYSRH